MVFWSFTLPQRKIERSLGRLSYLSKTFKKFRPFKWLINSFLNKIALLHILACFVEFWFSTLGTFYHVYQSDLRKFFHCEFSSQTNGRSMDLWNKFTFRGPKNLIVGPIFPAKQNIWSVKGSIIHVSCGRNTPDMKVYTFQSLFWRT